MPEKAYVPRRRLPLETRISAAALVVSALAVLLSQLRPLYTYLERADVQLHPAAQTTFLHSWGNVIGQQYVQLRNTGSAPGTVSSLRMTIAADDGSFVRVLPGASYYLKPDTVRQDEVVTQLPLGRLDIGPGETWEGFVTFFSTLSVEEQARIADLTRDVQQDIHGQIEAPNARRDRIFRVRNELHDEIAELSRARYAGLEPGPYSLLLEAFDDDGELLATKLFAWPLVEANLAAFDDILEDYRVGAGVYYPHAQQRGFVATLTMVEDTAALAKLRADRGRQLEETVVATGTPAEHLR